MLLDRHGQPIERPGAGLGALLRADRNVFEGVVRIKVYADAVEVKGTCAHCGGPIEGFLAVPEGYFKARDRDERIADAKRQVIDRVQSEHYCIPRLDGPKLPAADWLKRFS